MSKPKMKIKGLKAKPRKKMDLDAFIEAEMNNMSKKGGSKPPSSTKPAPGAKKGKKGAASSKPSFLSKNKVKAAPIELAPFEQPEEIREFSPNKGFKMNSHLLPKKIKPKQNSSVSPLNMSGQGNKLGTAKKAQGPAKLLELGKKAKERNYDDEEFKSKNNKDDESDDSYENYDDDEFESDDDKKDIK
jgi:hypothetical protein